MAGVVIQRRCGIQTRVNKIARRERYHCAIQRRCLTIIIKIIILLQLLSVLSFPHLSNYKYNHITKTFLL